MKPFITSLKPDTWLLALAESLGPTTAIIALICFTLSPKLGSISNWVVSLLLLITIFSYGAKAVRLMLGTWLTFIPGRESLLDPCASMTELNSRVARNAQWCCKDGDLYATAPYRITL